MDTPQQMVKMCVGCFEFDNFLCKSFHQSNVKRLIIHTNFITSHPLSTSECSGSPPTQLRRPQPLFALLRLPPPRLESWLHPTPSTLPSRPPLPLTPFCSMPPTSEHSKETVAALKSLCAERGLVTDVKKPKKAD